MPKGRALGSCDQSRKRWGCHCCCDHTTPLELPAENSLLWGQDTPLQPLGGRKVPGLLTKLPLL